MISDILKKHIDQIKEGGFIVFIKKLKTIFYLLMQSPIYLLSFPLIIIIRLIRPWLLIRWHGLASSRIGHIAINSELYSCKREAKIDQPSQAHIDIFFLKDKYVCNKQLVKMLRRDLMILPAFLLVPLFYINRFFNLFIKGGFHHEININLNIDRDIHNIMDKFDPHISFTEQEKLRGKKILYEFGIPKNAKFVCLVVRDSAYLDRYKDRTLKDFSYHNYRDGNVDNFLLAAEELANRGYYVFRMGVKVKKPLNSSNPKIIDYANSKLRSDFMDIYLCAHCTFSITTACGIDAVITVFRKPIAFIQVPFGHMQVQCKNDLLMTKHHFDKKNNKNLTISEIFSSNVALSFFSKEYEENNVELKENTPKEIRELAIEMEERVSGNWKETEKDLLLQKKFWEIFERNMKNLNFQNYKNPELIRSMYPMYCVKKRAKFSASFLRNNKDWIQ